MLCNYRFSIWVLISDFFMKPPYVVNNSNFPILFFNTIFVRSHIWQPRRNPSNCELYEHGIWYVTTTTTTGLRKSELLKNSRSENIPLAARQETWVLFSESCRAVSVRVGGGDTSSLRWGSPCIGCCSWSMVHLPLAGRDNPEKEVEDGRAPSTLKCIRADCRCYSSPKRWPPQTPERKWMKLKLGTTIHDIGQRYRVDNILIR